MPAHALSAEESLRQYVASLAQKNNRTLLHVFDPTGKAVQECLMPSKYLLDNDRRFPAALGGGIRRDGDRVTRLPFAPDAIHFVDRGGEELYQDIRDVLEDMIVLASNLPDASTINLATGRPVAVPLINYESACQGLRREHPNAAITMCAFGIPSKNLYRDAAGAQDKFARDNGLAIRRPSFTLTEFKQFPTRAPGFFDLHAIRKELEPVRIQLKDLRLNRSMEKFMDKGKGLSLDLELSKK